MDFIERLNNINSTEVDKLNDLYEELLIGDSPQDTKHLKIKKTKDSYIPYSILEVDLNILKSLIENNKVEDVKKMLEKIAKTYKSNSKIIDYIYVQQKNSER